MEVGKHLGHKPHNSGEDLVMRFKNVWVGKGVYF